MAVLSITSAVPADGAQFVVGVAGEAISIGQAVHYNKSDGKYYLADADNPNRRNLVGIAVTTCAANSQVVVQTSGEVTLGAAATPAEIYIAGATPGSVHPVGDAAASWGIMLLGIARTATVMKLIVTNTGIVK